MPGMTQNVRIIATEIQLAGSGRGAELLVLGQCVVILRFQGDRARVRVVVLDLRHLESAPRYHAD